MFPPSSHIVVKTRRGPRSEASEEEEADDGSQPKPENVTPLPSPAKNWTGEEWRASNQDGNSRAWNENSGKKNYWDWYNKPNWQTSHKAEWGRSRWYDNHRTASNSRGWHTAAHAKPPRKENGGQVREGGPIIRGAHSKSMAKKSVKSQPGDSIPPGSTNRRASAARPWTAPTHVDETAAGSKRRDETSHRSGDRRRRSPSRGRSRSRSSTERRTVKSRHASDRRSSRDRTRQKRRHRRRRERPSSTDASDSYETYIGKSEAAWESYDSDEDSRSWTFGKEDSARKIAAFNSVIKKLNSGAGGEATDVQRCVAPRESTSDLNMPSPEGQSEHPISKVSSAADSGTERLRRPQDCEPHASVEGSVDVARANTESQCTGTPTTKKKKRKRRVKPEAVQSMRCRPVWVGGCRNQDLDAGSGCRLRDAGCGRRDAGARFRDPCSQGPATPDPGGRGLARPPQNIFRAQGMGCTQAEVIPVAVGQEEGPNGEANGERRALARDSSNGASGVDGAELRAVPVPPPLGGMAAQYPCRVGVDGSIAGIFLQAQVAVQGFAPRHTLASAAPENARSGTYVAGDARGCILNVVAPLPTEHRVRPRSTDCSNESPRPRPSCMPASSSPPYVAGRPLVHETVPPGSGTAWSDSRQHDGQRRNGQSGPSSSRGVNRRVAPSGGGPARRYRPSKGQRDNEKKERIETNGTASKRNGTASKTTGRGRLARR